MSKAPKSREDVFPIFCGGRVLPGIIYGHTMLMKTELGENQVGLFPRIEAIDLLLMVHYETFVWEGHHLL